jgi:hypothetical protein
MKQSGLEYLIDKILFTNESYLDDEGDLTDVARTQYFNSYKSHVDLTRYVLEAREIDARKQLLVEMMEADEDLGLYNECTCDKCGKESRGSHSCPYDEEFNSGHSDSCNCCDSCRRECLMDI